MPNPVIRWWSTRSLGRNRDRLQRERDEEMRFHLELETAELIRRGLSPDAARRQARLAFGGGDRFREEASEGMALRWLDDLRRDVAFAVRSLRRSPAFTIVAVIALGLGIGANVTVFGFVDSIAFRKLQVREPERIVAVYMTQDDASLLDVSWPGFEDLRKGVRSFRDAAAFTEEAVNVKTAHGPVMALGVHVSENYFTLLGLEPSRGRMIEPGDHRNPVAVISDDFWKQQFNADAGIVGRSVVVNGIAYAIIGVAPSTFRGTRLFTYDPSIWLPIGVSASSLQGGANMLSARGQGRFTVLARLRDDVDLAHAELEANEIAKRSATRPEQASGLRFTLLPNSSPINPWLAPRSTIELLGRLMILGVCLVLAVACADVASLLLARMTVRRQEISTRLTLGATPSRLFRQLLTESLVLAGLGATAALPLSFVALKASMLLGPPLDFAPSFQPALNLRVLVFTVVVSVLSAIAFGLAPLLQLRSLRVDPGEHGSPMISGRSGSGIRSALIIGQVAISLVTLVCAGMFYRGLSAARAIDVGFDTRHAIVFKLDPLLGAGHDAAGAAAFQPRLDSSLAALPGVRSVSRATAIPLDGDTRTIRAFSGDPASATSTGVSADYFAVGRNYFETMGIPVISGRSFSAADATRFEPIVVNETLARSLWPGADPVGRDLRLGATGGGRATVVGVARSDVSRHLGDAPRPILWRSLEHSPSSRVTVIIRTQGDAAAVLPSVPAVIHSIDSTQPVFGLRTLSDRVAIAYSPAENGAIAGAIFGGLAAILAAAGLFGTVSYTVSQRSREIGVRRALGAHGIDIVRLVAGSTMRLTLLGIAIGLGVILLIPRKMSAILYGVSPHDPLLILIACAVFLIIAGLASLWPTWKALRIEPLEALRID